MSNRGRRRSRAEEEEQELVACYIAGATMDEVAESQGVSRQRIQQIFKRRGVSKKDQVHHWRKQTKCVLPRRRLAQVRAEAWKRTKRIRAEQVEVLQRLAIRLGRVPMKQEFGEAMGWKHQSIAGKVLHTWRWDKTRGSTVTSTERSWEMLYAAAGFLLPEDGRIFRFRHRHVRSA